MVCARLDGDGTVVIPHFLYTTKPKDWNDSYYCIEHNVGYWRIATIFVSRMQRRFIAFLFHRSLFGYSQDRYSQLVAAIQD